MGKWVVLVLCEGGWWGWSVGVWESGLHVIRQIIGGKVFRLALGLGPVTQGLVSAIQPINLFNLWHKCYQKS